MPLYLVKPDSLEAVHETSFASEGLKERGDLQRLLRDQPDVIEPGLFIVAEEFGDWEESRRRIDLLALDSGGRVVVVELKRTEDGGFMDLQSIRYASMVANMTFDQIVDAHRQYLTSRGVVGDAHELVLQHLHAADDESVEIDSQQPRMILVSGDFSRELTTSILWLNDNGLDIRCVRLQLYRSASDLLVDVTQVLPLPEAQDYIVRVRNKAAETPPLHPDVPWTADEIANLRDVVSNPTLTALFGACASQANEWVTLVDVIGESGESVAQARGAMGGLTTLIRGRFKRGNWPIESEWAVGGESQQYYRMSDEIARWWRGANTD